MKNNVPDVPAVALRRPMRIVSTSSSGTPSPGADRIRASPYQSEPVTTPGGLHAKSLTPNPDCQPSVSFVNSQADGATPTRTTAVRPTPRSVSVPATWSVPAVVYDSGSISAQVTGSAVVVPSL